MRIELVDPESVIMEELADRRSTQESVALTYAAIIRQQGKRVDWLRINRAITKRWKGRMALERVKRMAWCWLRRKS